MLFSLMTSRVPIEQWRIAICWPLKHPSRGLGWRELAGFIHFAYVDQLRGLNRLHDPKAISARRRDRQCRYVMLGRSELTS
jgi:hypothetical protein